MLKYRGKRVGVLGYSITGRAVVDYLKKKMADVYVSEIKNTKELADELSIKGVKYELGENSYSFLKECELVVVSPGIPPDNPIVSKLKANGIEVISEIELAFREKSFGKIIAVTGSNGKSTVTSLISHVISLSGKSSCGCGNLGEPFIDYIGSQCEFYVVEVSSFQLENTVDFRPDIAVLLNITPDHIDWHGSYENYKKAKYKIFKNQTSDDIAVLNKDDKELKDLFEAIESKKLTFSTRTIADAYYKDGSLFYRGEFIVKSEDLKIKGIHNIENTLSAIIVLKQIGLENESIREGLISFKPLPHRMELVGEIGGIKFINDSKATNVDSTYKAVSSIGKNLIVILGGRDKGGDFSILRKPLKENAKAAILIGEAKEKIKEQIKGSVKIFEEDSLKEAVFKGLSISKPGDTILLSPGCASFDMYKNYKERGEDFRKIVGEILEERDV